MSKWACTATTQLIWGERVRRRLVAQLRHIREWTIEQRSFAEIPDQWATWFIDPPYQGKPGRAYRHNVVDYAALAAYCQSRSGRVIVCENAGADWLPFAHLAYIKAGGGARGGHRTSHEVVWSPDIPGPRAL
jgi:16S rRNA G966 N2-methylase RsmD